MDKDRLREILEDLRKGGTSVEAAMESLVSLPFEDLGFACIDHHRGIRRGASEVIFGEGKDSGQILVIMGRMAAQGDKILVTRLSREKADDILRDFPEGTYHATARALTLVRKDVRQEGRGNILVMSAGTSDIPVAEEAAITAEFLGNRVERVNDVGVSGLHRLFSHREKIVKASVIIVVAGMEGALPSVVAGLVEKPVIAVPTSVGYGTGFGGIAALLGMLNSCASGVTVVNIDNGFGAGYAASVINTAAKGLPA